MIIRKDDLEAAVEHGVISAQSARDLTDFTLKRAKVPRAVNEQFKLFNNFSEVFICLGLFIVYGAFSSITSTALLGLQVLPAGVIGFWLLAEFFTFRTTKNAPAMVAALMACLLALHSVMHFAGFEVSTIWTLTGEHAPVVWGTLAGLLALAFARFRIPFILAPLVISLSLFAISYSGSAVFDKQVLAPIGLVGVLAIALAIWFDSRDPLRRSRQNAYAFWLFVVGSPMAVHPVFSTIWLNGDGARIQLTLAAIFVAAVVATLVGLILDRRSLVASSLVYFTVSIGYLNFGLSGNLPVALAVTSLIIGCFVILLGVLWYRVRNIVMLLVPAVIARKLPPIN